MLVTLAGCATPAGAPPIKLITPKQQLTSAYQLLEQKRYDQANVEADAFLRNRSSGPGVAEAFYVKGRVCEANAEVAGSAGQAERARAQLTAAANIYLRAIAQTPAPAVEGLARAGFANAAFFLEDYPTAVREYAAAYPLLPKVESKARTLYRIALCQQRMGCFDQADRSFALLQRGFPGTEAAERAGNHVGRRAFYLQVGAFPASTRADREITRLRSLGYVSSRGNDPATGRQIVQAGPFVTYAEARGAQTVLASTYPDAMVVP